MSRGLALLTFSCLLLNCGSVLSQGLDSSTERVQKRLDATQRQLSTIPANYADRIEAKAASIDASLTKATAKYVAKCSQLEARILSRLQRIDPSKTRSLTASPYDRWLNQLSGGNSSATPLPTSYVAGLDTLNNSILFLKANGSQNNLQSLGSASSQLAELQGNFNESAVIDRYLQIRRQELGAMLAQYQNLPASVTELFNKYKETAYYYRTQVQAYKDMLNDPGKVEATALKVLNHVPAFQQFLSHNSILASLFASAPGSGATAGALPVNLGNLQTRSQVQQLIQQQISQGGPSAQLSVQQQMQVAQSQLTSLRQQASQYVSARGGSDMDLPPGFKPNSQKTKTFLKRLEYGANVQFAQSTYAFPATANLGLMVGYKINDKSSAGVGLAYTAGMGTGWEHIRFSNQAIGLRSFMDWKIKKTFYVVGGYEENYMTQFSSISDLRNVSAWQKSVLIGLEKKYKISSKLQGNMQVMFDALYKQEIPQGQMIKFRFGYNF